MFVDFVAVLLLNMMTGFLILAAYVIRGLDDPDQKRWAPGFGIAGFIALLLGTIMVTTWPLPGPYNIAYGELSVLFGAIFLATAIALVHGWNLQVIAGYAFFAGAASIVVGGAIINLKLTLEPVKAGVGFILSGLGGVFAYPALAFFRGNKPVRWMGGLMLIAAAVIWGNIVYPEYFTHLQMFQKWVPSTMSPAMRMK